MIKYFDKDDVVVRDSVANDAIIIAHNMRPSDKDEIWASHRKTPLQGLMSGYAESTLCFTVCYLGKPVMMFGAVPQTFLGDEATIWMLASNGFCKCHRKLLRYGGAFIGYMLKHYSVLTNYVDSRNQLSIRWLKWCKAQIDDAIPFGIDKLPFHRFSFEREIYA
jgi:hypothetical protein